jgi:hypothetical protein
MASPEAIGTAACMCGEKVYVAKNSGGFPYYRCPACGVEVRHHRHSAAAKFMREKVTIFQADQTPAEPEKAVKHEPMPAAKPAPKSVVSSLLLG